MTTRSMASALGSLAVLLGLAACQHGTSPGPPSSFLVDSDPQGATIYLDGQSQNLVTPDSLRDVPAGTHTIGLLLDTAGIPYQFVGQTNIQADSMPPIRWPLLLRCGDTTCLDPFIRRVTAAGMDFNVGANGTLFFQGGSGGGLFYPAGSNQSYLSVGAPVSAGYMGTYTPSVGPSPYDFFYYAGRPAPDTLRAGDVFQLTQRSWLVPPPSYQQYLTGRGLKMDEQIVTDEAYPGTIFLRVVFRNITGDTLYQMSDPVLYGSGSLTYQNAYLGFAIDPDIGDPSDDIVSYVPDENMVFAYDSNFQEAGFGPDANAPALVGLEMLQAPAGATIVMTGWPSSWDWRGATTSEANALPFLSGTQPDTTTGAPNYPDPSIGYVPTTPADVRIAVTAGPLTLAAGDSAVFRIAVVIAPPVSGTFQSGTFLAPGDPTNGSRAILSVAGNLVQRAQPAANRP
jgi:hypothetical protein